MDRSVMMIIIVLTTTYFSPYDYGQDTGRSEKKPIIYTGIVNIVPDQFNFPLIGFINLANGSHNSSHIGFINVNEKDFTGVQVSFVNTVGGEVKGTQIGFVDVCDDPLTGLQLGFVNVAGKRTHGAQIGFVNTTSSIKGLQLGFVNVTDTLDKGIPLGFVSIVKVGGYRALEFSLTEMFPVNLSFKIGIKKLYSFFTASYNPDWGKEFAAGIGLGSILSLNESIYFNPELSVQSPIVNENPNNRQIVSFAANMGYCVSKKVNLAIGPSVVWNHAGNPDDLEPPFFSVYRYEIDDSNDLIVGLRIALRYNLSD